MFASLYRGLVRFSYEYTGLVTGLCTADENEATGEPEPSAKTSGNNKKGKKGRK